MFGSTFTSPGGSNKTFLPFGVYNQLSPLSPLGVKYFVYAATIGRNIKLNNWDQWLYVLGVNDNVNFWTINIEEIVTPAVISSVNTSLSAGGVNLVLSNKVFTPSIIGRSITSIFITAAPSTPAVGSLFIGGPMLEIIF